MNFQGVPFLFEFNAIPHGVKSGLWPSRKYRPQLIILRNGRNGAVIFLGWDNVVHGGAALIAMTDPVAESGAPLTVVSPPQEWFDPGA